LAEEEHIAKVGQKGKDGEEDRGERQAAYPGVSLGAGRSSRRFCGKEQPEWAADTGNFFSDAVEYGMNLRRIAECKAAAVAE
jgi:hypothetical protein